MTGDWDELGDGICPECGDVLLTESPLHGPYCPICDVPAESPQELVDGADLRNLSAYLRWRREPPPPPGEGVPF